MGHGFGLGHSRRDGSKADYQDPWDIMSTLGPYSAPDPDYCARGPGLNAWNMRGRGWLDESRVCRVTQVGFNQEVELRPLHRRDLPGFLAAELPPTSGHSPYLVEFRLKKDWDVGMPRSAVFVHHFLTAAQDNDGWPHSYLMSGTNGNHDLVAGDVFAPGVSGGGLPHLEVLKIDENNNSATVRLSIAPLSTNVAPGAAGSGNTTAKVVTSPDGRILYDWWELGQGSQGFRELDGNGRTDAAPAAALVGPQHHYLFVVVKGLDGHLYLNQGELGKPFVGWQ